jgi:hypothetical protein
MRRARPQPVWPRRRLSERAAAQVREAANGTHADSPTRGAARRVLLDLAAAACSAMIVAHRCPAAAAGGAGQVNRACARRKAGALIGHVRVDGAVGTATRTVCLPGLFLGRAIQAPSSLIPRSLGHKRDSPSQVGWVRPLLFKSAGRFGSVRW